jgi:hypothetical protein
MIFPTAVIVSQKGSHFFLLLCREFLQHFSITTISGMASATKNNKI